MTLENNRGLIRIVTTLLRQIAEKDLEEKKAALNPRRKQSTRKEYEGGEEEKDL